jgi:hypothetical protein
MPRSTSSQMASTAARRPPRIENFVERLDVCEYELVPFIQLFPYHHHPLTDARNHHGIRIALADDATNAAGPWRWRRGLEPVSGRLNHGPRGVPRQGHPLALDSQLHLSPNDHTCSLRPALEPPARPPARSSVTSLSLWSSGTPSCTSRSSSFNGTLPPWNHQQSQARSRA